MKPSAIENWLLCGLIERTLSDALSSGIWSSLRARDQLGPLQNSARRLEEALRASKAAREARAQGAIGHQDNGFNWQAGDHRAEALRTDGVV